jgi:hypothetical protein
MGIKALARGACAVTLAVAMGAPVAASAELRSQPECNDGIDNDEDGSVDLEDTDCESENDDSEAHIDVRYRSVITIRYARDEGAFKGRVISGPSKCYRHRKVALWRRSNGHARVVGLTRTGRNGWWRIDDFTNARGAFHAKARRPTGDRWQCLAARSKTIRIPSH